MEFNVLDDFGPFDSSNNKFKIKRNNDVKTSEPMFLSKEEREKHIREELHKEKELEKLKEEKILDKKFKHLKKNRRSYSRDRKRKYSISDDDNKRKRSRSRSRSRDRRRRQSHEIRDNYEEVINLNNKEREEIKKHYLGLNKEKRRIVKPSEKFRNVFHFEWKNEEDTSRDINPLYSTRLEPKLLFGRGDIGGINSKEIDKRKDDIRKKDNLDKVDKKHSIKRWSKILSSEMTDRDWRIFR